MNLELTADQELFRETTHRFIEREAPLTEVRALYDTVEGFDRYWWARAADLGWTSLFVPEALDGSRLSATPTGDAAIVAEEMGRLVSPGPFLPVTVVAAAIDWYGSEAQQAQLLPGLRSGQSVAAWAYTESRGRWRPEQMSTTATVLGDEVILDGAKTYVEAAGVADCVLVSARTGHGMSQVLVPTASVPGVSVVRGRSIDMTRRFGSVRFDGARLPISAFVGEPGHAAAAVERQLSLALALQCAEMVGVADRALELTLDYGRDRIAFGRPILSFQALKHRIADLWIWLEGSKAVSEQLVAAVDDQSEGVPTLASVAKAYVGEHCLDIVDECVQINGGIAVTWEHDIHLYSRRAVVDQLTYGTPEEHKRHLVERLRGAG